MDTHRIKKWNWLPQYKIILIKPELQGINFGGQLNHYRIRNFQSGSCTLLWIGMNPLEIKTVLESEKCSKSKTQVYEKHKIFNWFVSLEVSILFLFKLFHIIPPSGKVFKMQLGSFNPNQVKAKLMKSFASLKPPTYITDHTMLVAFLKSALSKIIE